MEKIAPSEKEWLAEQGGVENSAPVQRKIISPLSTSGNTAMPEVEKEILIVVSKLKAYIAARSDLSTSADVMEKLSDHLRNLCDKAITNARNSGRKTVMARDFLV